MRSTTQGGSGLKAGARQTPSRDYVSDMTGLAASDSYPGSLKINPDLQDVVRQVHLEFADLLDPQEIDACLVRVGAKFDNAKVRSFVPLLVRRYVCDELQETLGLA